MEKGRKMKEYERNFLVLEGQINGKDRYSSVKLSIDFKQAEIGMSLLDNVKNAQRTYSHIGSNPIQVALELTIPERKAAIDLIKEAKKKGESKHSNKRQIAKKIDLLLSVFDRIGTIRM
ncbi:MAG: hypothetical protein ACP5LP_02585 [Candidatus Micrarchaeia archaeon]